MANSPLPTAYGGVTTDGYPLEQLYQEWQMGIATRNQDPHDFRAEFCEMGTMKTYSVPDAVFSPQKMGRDVARPLIQSANQAVTNLPTPGRYGWGTGITRDALANGISRTMWETSMKGALDADIRLCNTMIIAGTALQTGGYYDGMLSVAPPIYGNEIFTTSHNHYLFDNAANGTPALKHFTALLWHIFHHGYIDLDSFVAWISPAQAQNIQNLDWAQELPTNVTVFIENLRNEGASIRFQVAGVPVAVTTWMPDGYLLMTSTMEKSMYWRNPEGDARDGALRIISEPPSIEYGYLEWLERYGSAAVIKRGAGAAYYLDGSSWANPAINLPCLN